MIYTRVRIVLLAALLCVGATTFAQEEVGVTIQPTLIEEAIEPGSEYAGTIMVTNVSGVEQTYRVLARNVERVDISGRPFFTTETEPGTLAAWVSFATTELTLAPAQSERIGYRIRVPDDASPGAHFAGVFVDRSAETLMNSGAGIGFQVGALMSIQVGGEVIERLAISEFSSERVLYTSPDTRFSIRVRNEGNVYEEVQGVLTIRDMFGNQIDNTTLETFRVVPGFERERALEWQGDGFHIGRYTAIVSLVHGKTARMTVMREISFWIIPITQLLWVVGGVCLALLLIGLWTRTQVRRALARAGMTRDTRTSRHPWLLLATALFLMLFCGLLVLFFLFT